MVFAVLEWSYQYLRQPDGDSAGEPWRFTPEQARFLSWWYALDAHGRWQFPRGVFERMKGAGKDPLGGALGCIELVGPARPELEFGGLVPFKQDLYGPTSFAGVRHTAAWVQIAAVSKDQTRNTMTLFASMFSEDAKNEFGLDIGKEIIYAKKTNGRLEAVTSSPKALEGTRPTFVLRNETHHWLSNNDGHEMMKVMARNVGKARGGGARMLDITNAHAPGEDSVAERMWDSWQKMQSGQSRGSGLLYDSREAPASTVLSNPESLRKGLIAARGDSSWLDIDGIMQIIYSPETSVTESRRFYLNQKIAPEDAWVAPVEWAALTDPSAGRGPAKLEDGDKVVMFFDGSKSDDSTGLVAVRVSDGAIFQLGVWERPVGWDDQHGANRWIVDRHDVDHVVRAAFERFSVVAFWADPSDAKEDSGERYWGGLIDAWHRDFKHKLKALAAVKTGDKAHSIEWDMRSPDHVKMFTQAAERFVADVQALDMVHDDSPALAQHVKNARRRPNQYGVSLSKEHRESARKVDLAVCAVGARMLWRLWLNKQRRDTGPARIIVLD